MFQSLLEENGSHFVDALRFCYDHRGSQSSLSLLAVVQRRGWGGGVWAGEVGCCDRWVVEVIRGTAAVCFMSITYKGHVTTYGERNPSDSDV